VAATGIGKGYLHLPNAPGGSAGSSGKLPKMRHGIRAANSVSSCPLKKRTLPERHNVLLPHWARVKGKNKRHDCQVVSVQPTSKTRQHILYFDFPLRAN
jgi:hypothetical protein